MPSGNGGFTGRPLTKWVSGLGMGSTRPGRARCSGTISRVLPVPKIMLRSTSGGRCSRSCSSHSRGRRGRLSRPEGAGSAPPRGHGGRGGAPARGGSTAPPPCPRSAPRTLPLPDPRGLHAGSRPVDAGGRIARCPRAPGPGHAPPAPPWWWTSTLSARTTRGQPSLADLVAEGPRKADLSPGPARGGGAAQRRGEPGGRRRGGGGPGRRLGPGGAPPAAPARPGDRRPPGGPGAPAGPGGSLPSRPGARPSTSPPGR